MLAICVSGLGLGSAGRGLDEPWGRAFEGFIGIVADRSGPVGDLSGEADVLGVGGAGGGVEFRGRGLAPELLHPLQGRLVGDQGRGLECRDAVLVCFR